MPLTAIHDFKEFEIQLSSPAIKKNLVSEEIFGNVRNIILII